MNAKRHQALTLAALLTLAAGPAGAADHGAMDHGSMGHGAAPTSPSAGSGELRRAVVSGHTLVYSLFDMRGKAPATPGVAMKSHHLMVYATAPDGKPAAGGQAGFLVVGPDKAEAKTMAMQMGDGFGADVDLAAKGEYTITTKIALGGATLVDTFTYTAK